VISRRLSRVVVALAIICGVLAGAPRAEAVQAEVPGQVARCAGNDVACGFPSATTPGNAVLALGWVAAAETITINNSTFAFTATNNSPFSPTNMTTRMYSWCGIADGDNNYTFTTSGASAAAVVMVEATNTGCTPDAVGSGEGNSGVPAGPVTTNATSTFVVALARSNANRTWTAGTGYTLIAPSGASTSFEGEYRAVTANGAQAADFALSSGTSWAVISAAFPESGGGRGGGGGGGPNVGSLAAAGAGR
jgi:hypothetical protein